MAVLFTYLFILFSLKCSLKCMKSKVRTHLLPAYIFEDNNTSNQITVLTSVSFWISILVFYLIIMTMFSRIFDKSPSPLIRNDSFKINLLNRIISNTLVHSMVFLMSFAYYLFNKVETADELNDAFLVGASWVLYRVVYVFSYFISVEIKISTFRTLGFMHSVAISVYFICLNLGIQKITWIYN